MHSLPIICCEKYGFFLVNCTVFRLAVLQKVDSRYIINVLNTQTLNTRQARIV